MRRRGFDPVGFFGLPPPRPGEFRAAGRALPLILYAGLAVLGCVGTVLAIYLAVEILTTNR